MLAHYDGPNGCYGPSKKYQVAKKMEGTSQTTTLSSSRQQVETWLHIAGLSHLLPHCIQHGIADDEARFRGLTMKDFHLAGVRSLEDRKKLFMLLSKLNDPKQTTSPSSPSSVYPTLQPLPQHLVATTNHRRSSDGFVALGPRSKQEQESTKGKVPRRKSADTAGHPTTSKPKDPQGSNLKINRTATSKYDEIDDNEFGSDDEDDLLHPQPLEDLEPPLEADEEEVEIDDDDDMSQLNRNEDSGDEAEEERYSPVKRDTNSVKKLINNVSILLSRGIPSTPTTSSLSHQTVPITQSTQQHHSPTGARPPPQPIRVSVCVRKR